MMTRYALRDDQWERIRDSCQGERAMWGARRRITAGLWKRSCTAIVPAFPGVTSPCGLGISAWFIRGTLEYERGVGEGVQAPRGRRRTNMAMIIYPGPSTQKGGPRDGMPGPLPRGFEYQTPCDL